MPRVAESVVGFIYGGFTWMLAAGSSEKVQKGKDILIWATLGLVVIFSAYARGCGETCPLMLLLDL
ncbi:hypothetical protein KAU09_02120 [Candidatus Parcubacteria bacterium]|nr:hypothetical protein [Candidatus Parcubacteria bacterium]